MWQIFLMLDNADLDLQLSTAIKFYNCILQHCSHVFHCRRRNDDDARQRDVERHDRDGQHRRLRDDVSSSNRHLGLKKS